MVQFLRPRDVVLHVDHRPGTVEVRPIVFANSLSTDLRIWDAVRDRLDGDIPTLALDKRGHGLSGHGVSEPPDDRSRGRRSRGRTAARSCGAEAPGQARAMIETVDPSPDNPVVALGDLDGWGRRRGSLAPFFEAMSEVTCGPFCPVRRPFVALDRIFHRGPIAPADSGVWHNGAASMACDHLPIWADFRLGGS